MQTEIKNCQNCKTDFLIEPEDFGFYAKMQVPPPTFCPGCRRVRRLAAAHPMRLYRKTCDVPGHSEELISKFPPSSDVTVYDPKYWWSDAWDVMDFGFEYDFSRPFFEQLDELYRRVPAPAVDVINSVNCDYCITAHNSKNCYFLVGGFRSEECLYSDTPAFSKNVVDSYVSLGSDTLYECLYCDGSFNLKYSSFCEGCMDSAFLYDCKGCSDCFGCANLRNKKYCIFNVQYSKAEYQERIKEFDLSSREGVEDLRNKYREFLKGLPVRYANIVSSVDCTGDVISQGKNCRNCFEVRQGAENCKYAFGVGVGAKDSYDVFAGGATSALLYDSKAIISSERVLFSNKINNSRDVYYSLGCAGSSDLFACAGLRHKKFCIFNRQYSEKEYRELVPRIMEHMNEMPYTDARGNVYRFGEYPPPALSPLPYNESLAQVLYPLDAAGAAEGGFLWQEQERKNFDITVRAENIPSAISVVPDDIVAGVLECADKGACEHGCLQAFRIIPRELAFYRKTGTPLPAYCPVCRYAKRMEAIRFRITPIEQTKRECGCGGDVSRNGRVRNVSGHPHGKEPCPNTFLTSYTPDREETVYCEQCFQAEL